MWRRIYLFLLAVRLYFALSPSYIHPDEHFQGPEVITGTCGVIDVPASQRNPRTLPCTAPHLLLPTSQSSWAACSTCILQDSYGLLTQLRTGHVFNWSTHKTWEFTSVAPIRSYFPLWLVYGLPLKFLDTIIIPGAEPPKPFVIFYFWRILFFLLSFVLGMLTLRFLEQGVLCMFALRNNEMLTLIQRIGRCGNLQLPTKDESASHFWPAAM